MKRQSYLGQGLSGRLLSVDATFALSSFAAIFAIIDPVGNLPFYLTLTDGYSPELKERVIRNVVITAIAILVVFGVAGNIIFGIFQTSINAFRIAGGLLLFTIGFRSIYGERSGARITEKEHAEAGETEAAQVGVVPLGIPLFAGPGAITTVVVLTGGTPLQVDPAKFGVVLASVGLTMIISYILLHQADRVSSRFGRTGMLAFSRIMGLILAAIAIQFIILGVQGAYRDCFVSSPCV